MFTTERIVFLLKNDWQVQACVLCLILAIVMIIAIAVSLKADGENKEDK